MKSYHTQPQQLGQPLPPEEAHKTHRRPNMASSWRMTPLASSAEIASPMRRKGTARPLHKEPSDRERGSHPFPLEPSSAAKSFVCATTGLFVPSLDNFFIIHPAHAARLNFSMPPQMPFRHCSVIQQQQHSMMFIAPTIESPGASTRFNTAHQSTCVVTTDRYRIVEL